MVFFILSYFFFGWSTIKDAIQTFPGFLGLLMMSIIALILILSFLSSFRSVVKVARAPNYKAQLNKTLSLFGGLGIGKGGGVEVPLKGKPLLELWNSYRAEYRRRKDSCDNVIEASKRKRK